MLIFDPAGAWDRIESSPRTVARVFFLFLLPLLLLSSVAETWELMHFGRERSTIGDMPAQKMKVSPQLALRYQAAQVTFGLAIAFGGALIYRKIGEGFHRRHSFTETFATLGYSIGPLFLLRMLDGLPHLNTWVCWAIGVTLSVAGLYRGIPRIMKPDPSSAIGLYLMCSLLLIALSGIAHYLANLVLEEKFLAGVG